MGLNELFFIRGQEIERPIYTDRLCDSYQQFFSNLFAGSRLTGNVNVPISLPDARQIVLMWVPRGPGSAHCGWFIDKQFNALTVIVLGLSDDSDHDAVLESEGNSQGQFPAAYESLRKSPRPAVLTLFGDRETMGSSPIIEASLGLARAMVDHSGKIDKKPPLGQDVRQPENAYLRLFVLDTGQFSPPAPWTLSVLRRTTGDLLQFGESFEQRLKEDSTKFEMCWQVGMGEVRIEGGVVDPDMAVISVNSVKGGTDSVVLLSRRDPAGDEPFVQIMEKTIPTTRGVPAETFVTVFETIRSSPRPLAVIFSEKGSSSDAAMLHFVVEEILAATFFRWRRVI